MAYADVLVAAEVNSFTGCNLSRGFVTVCRKVPTLVSSFFYSVQLAYVYCVGIGFACFYIGNLTCMVKGYATINYSLSTIQYYRSTCTILHASSTLSNCKSCIAIFQQQSSSIKANSFITIANGFDILQLIVQLYFNISTIIAYFDIVVAAEVNSCIRCNFSRGFVTVCRKVPTLVSISSSFTYLLQLCYVYCVSIFSTCCYIGNLTSNFFTLYRTAYRNSTISCLPSNTGFSFSSTIAKRVGSCACYAANAQSNAAFYAYACTIANSNCIISRNRILMTEGNNIAYAFDCVFVTHYNGIGNIGQCIVGACHEYIMADIFLTTDKPVIIADNGRIGLFENSVSTADYCNGTALLFSENRIVTAKNS